MKARRLLNIDEADIPPLLLMAPVFAVTAAAIVALATLSKALFLSANPIALLPWVFLGAAALTVVGSLGYVAVLRRFRLATRFVALLAVAMATLVGLRLAFGVHPRIVSILVALWCPAVANLIALQSWNLATSLLPTRQGKRLLPVLAAITTGGAVVGGGLVQVTLTWRGAEDLLWLAVALLGWPLLAVRRVVTRLVATVAGDEPPATEDRQAKEPARDEPPMGRGSEVLRGLRGLVRSPLLATVAAFVFLMQAASLLIDYQLSAELKTRFDKDQMASFLGLFYWVSNLIVLVLSLVLTSRFVRLVGIGVTLAASAICVGIGSAAYWGAAAFALAPTFWIIAATAFAERITQYAFTKPAVQMIVMPLPAHETERAKTLIDGVVYRLATALVSVGLLLAAPTLLSLPTLSIPAAIACVVVVVLALRVGPHYRQAIFSALRESRLDTALTRYLEAGLGRGSLQEVEKRLRSDDPAAIRQALGVVREIKLPVENELLTPHMTSSDVQVSQAALAAWRALGRPLPLARACRLLEPDRPPKILTAVLQLVEGRDEPELFEAVRPLITHDDPSVASAACVFRMCAAGRSAIVTLEEEIVGAEVIAAADGAAIRRITGTTRASEYARELPGLLNTTSVTIRREAVEQMGKLALPYFIDPLVEALDDPALRAEAIEALTNYGADLIPALGAKLDNQRFPLVTRLRLLHVVEQLASPAALELLVEHCGATDTSLRNQAVLALWRLAGNEQRQPPNPQVLAKAARGELERLRTYAAIEAGCFGKLTRRKAFFVAELAALGLQTESRVFRLLGMLTDREALHRAHLNYRSNVVQVRSNAIELLEQHLGAKASSLSEFVALVERAEDGQGNLRPRSVAYRGRSTADVGELIDSSEPWLQRVWRWVTEGDEKGRHTFGWDDPLDRVLELKAIPLFSKLTGQELLPLGDIATRITMKQDQPIFEQGAEGRKLYAVLAGEVEVLRDDESIARLGVGQCFGELSLLDDKPRSATVTARRAGELLCVARAGFRDVLDLHPALATGIIELLTKRLRDTIAAKKPGGLR
ncbi:MAG: cyclic nucleotide-binding domain-containing protein [Deltaproteobacteria bacterium]|nr:cyclic nucleotide-binding domain-containing protein [Deltaproteobacteria bacterium]